MDYCHPCRRHLNGALVCPGCAMPAAACRAYAEALAAQEAADGPEETYAEEVRPRGRSRRERRLRAARRAHRRRRRTMLYVAVGLVLAAGGLSLAELGSGALDDAPSSAAGDGGADGPPPAGDTAQPPGDAQASATRPKAAGTSPSASRSGKGEKSADEDDDDKKAEEGGSESAPDPATSADSAPSSSAPATTSSRTPTTEPPSAEPPRTPEPSTSCNRILWWCA